MTDLSPWTRTVTMAAALVLSAAVASPQSAMPGPAATPQDHARSHVVQPFATNQSMAAMHKGMMARMATDDARLKALTADMNMLTGDLKIEAMARLLTLLVEQHSMMRDRMLEMHGRMMGRMMEGMPDAVAEEEPGAMCSPAAN